MAHTPACIESLMPKQAKTAQPQVFTPTPKNKVKGTYDERRGSSTQRGYDYRWQKFSAIYRDKHPLCVHCRTAGQIAQAEHVDHITPLCDGGSKYAESNLQSLCERCHASKTRREQTRGQRFVVCGAPGHGKSTWVQRQRAQGDHVFDWDAIANVIFARGTLHSDDFGTMSCIREAFIDSILSYSHARSVYFIVAKITTAKLIAIRLGASVILLENGTARVISDTNTDVPLVGKTGQGGSESLQSVVL